MKYLYLILTIVLVSCKSTKETSILKEENKELMEYGEKLSDKLDSIISVETKVDSIFIERFINKGDTIVIKQPCDEEGLKDIDITAGNISITNKDGRLVVENKCEDIINTYKSSIEIKDRFIKEYRSSIDSLSSHYKSKIKQIESSKEVRKVYISWQSLGLGLLIWIIVYLVLKLYFKISWL